MNKTKKKILLSAIDLFNESGVFTVRNQDIAEHAGISLSNYNYHFATKKDLILAVLDYLGELLEKQVYGQHALLTKEGMGLEIARSYFEFEKSYRFFYLETHAIIKAFPELQVRLKEQIDQAIQLIRNSNFLAIGKGYMKPPPSEKPDLYDKLAEQIWMNNHFWIAQMNINGKEGDIVEEGIKNIYYICYPYLTEVGIARYEAYFAATEEKTKA